MLTDSDAGVFFDTLKPILPCDFGRVMSLQKIAESGELSRSRNVVSTQVSASCGVMFSSPFFPVQR